MKSSLSLSEPQRESSGARRPLHGARAGVAIGLVLVLWGCKSFEEIQAPADAKSDLPVIKLQAKGADTSRTAVRSRGASDPIRLVVRRAEKLEFAEAVATKKFLGLLGSSRIQFITAPEGRTAADLRAFPEKKDAAAFLKDVNADALADLAFLEDDGGTGRFKMRLRLLDPRDGKVIVEKNQDVEVLERKIDPANQLDFYRRGGTVHALQAKSEKIVRFLNFNREGFRTALLGVISGKLQVYSASGAAEVFLWKGRSKTSLGPAPVIDRVLEEGRYKVTVSRRGYPSKNYDIAVFAGRTKRIYVEWPDSPRGGTASILSTPPGLRVALDGVIKGNTPIYLTNLEKGSYGLEVSRPGKDGNYEVVAESAINMGSGGADRVFFINYKENFGSDLLAGNIWQLSSEEGKLAYAPTDGLGFRTSTRLDVWQGLVSRGFALSSFRMELDVVGNKDNVLAFGVEAGEDTVMVKMRDGLFYVSAHRNKKLVSGLKSFKPLKPAPTHKLILTYDSEKKMLAVGLGGDTVYEGKLNPAPFGRVFILTKPGSADGRVLARRLTIKAGRGLYDRD